MSRNVGLKIKCAFCVIAIGFLTLFLFSNCGQKQSRRISILHTNDMHGHFQAEPAPWLDDKPLIGGFVALDYYVREERRDTPDLLLFDAGDLMTGNPICDIDYKNAEGGALIEMMNLIGYDGMVAGNHEFDKPMTNALNLVTLAQFPMICANLIDTLGNNFTSEKYHIYDVSDLRVGVIGITYHQMVGMAKPENLMGFASIDPAETVNKIVGDIDRETDLIIILSHQGYENDIKLAEKINNIDVIVGGHSHRRIEKPEKVNGVLIVQAGSYTRYLGRLDLTVAGDTIQTYAGKLIPTFVKSIEINQRLESFVDSFAVIVDREYGRVIGSLKADWKSAYRAESNVGDWITDVMREKTGADVAFVNSGGIRKNVSAGPLTLKDIAEMLPFQNYVEIFECTGSDLMTILTENANAEGNETHGILQLSGVSYSWRKQDGHIKIVNAAVNGRPIEKNTLYTIACIDYVIINYDRYFEFQPQNINSTGILITDMVIEAIEEEGEILSRIEGRIKQVK